MASFIITKDKINDGEYNGEMYGNEEYLKAGKAKHKFRLLDDDGEIYFYGKSGNSSCFNPLDRFGSAFGCTDLQYYNEETKKYESL